MPAKTDWTDILDKPKADWRSLQPKSNWSDLVQKPEIPVPQMDLSVPQISMATTLAKGEIPQPQPIHTYTGEPEKVKSLTDVGAISRNIIKFIPRAIKGTLGGMFGGSESGRSTQEMNLKNEAFQYYKNQGLEDRQAYDLATKAVEEQFPRQTTKEILAEAGSETVGLPGIKAFFKRPLSALEKPEEIAQPLGILLGAKAGFERVTGFKPFQPIADIINKTWQKASIPVSNIVYNLTQKFAGDFYNSNFGSLRKSNPELLSMLQEATGKKEELVGKIQKGGQALEEAKNMLMTTSPKVAELRISQLLEQPTVAQGKLPLGDIPKAGITSDPEIAKNMDLVQGIQASLGKQLVEQKKPNGEPALDPETYFQTNGAYLKRLYEKPVPTTKVRFPFKKYKLGLTELKERGKTARQMEEDKWQNVIDESKKELSGYTFENVPGLGGITGIRLKRAGYTLDEVAQLEPADAKVLAGQIKNFPVSQAEKVINTARNYVARNKELQKKIVEAQRMKDWAGERTDIPYQVRMNELKQITDPTTRFVIGGLQSANDIVNFKLFENMYNKGKSLGKVSDTEKTGFVQQPNSPRYGHLADKWVSPDWHREIFDLVSQPEQWSKSYQAVVSLIKKNLTVRNPFTQTLNYLSNFMFADLGDLSVLDYQKGLQDIYFNKNPKLMDEFQKSGRVKTTWTQEELKPILDKFYGVLDTKTPLMTQIPRMMDAFTEETLGKIPFFSSKLYQAADLGLQWSLYRKYRLEGMNPTQAMAELDKWAQNYKDLPPIVKKLRTSPLPVAWFISYPAEMIRIMKNAAIYKPTKLIKWLGIPLTLPYIFQKTQGITDDEINAAKQGLPWWQKTGLNIQIPIKNEDGSVSINDMSYLIPWTSVTNFTNPRSMFQNPIFTSGIEAISGKDFNTGRDIVKPEQSVTDKTQIWLNRFAKASAGAPYRIPSKIVQYYQGKPDITGHVQTGGELINQLFSPVKTTEMTPEKINLQIGIAKGELNDLKGRFRKIGIDFNQGRITKGQQLEQNRRIKDQIDEKVKQINQLQALKNKINLGQ